jgi:hypothetical protein
MDRVLYLAAVLLIPLIPAFLIFKLLPGSSVTASGPLQGLTVNMSGAFAGYVVLLLIAIAVMPKSSEALYTFEGYLALEADPSIHPSNWIERVDAALIPSSLVRHPDGRIQLRFAYDPERPAAEQPSLTIQPRRSPARLPTPD